MAGAGGLVPAVAHAATPVDLVVSTPDRGCSDTDASKPFCTVNAALADPALVPGSTIQINGDHPEDVSVTTSGISMWVGPWGGGSMRSLTVSNAQNVELSGFWSAFTVSGSSNVKLHGIHSGSLTVKASQEVTIDGNAQLFGTATAATIQNSSGTTITNSMIEGGQGDNVSPGLLVTGDASVGTSVVHSYFQSNGTSAIVLSGQSSGTTIAADEFYDGRGAAIVATGSPHNVITGNTMRYTPQGIVATAGSTDLTIADNIISDEESFPNGFAGPMVVVDARSTSGSSIHHNIVDLAKTDYYDALLAQPSSTSQVLGQSNGFGHRAVPGPAYSWGGTVYQDAAALHTNTGQGNADINADPQFMGPCTLDLRATSPAIDSADSSAPGWQDTDYSGAARFHDPQAATSGTGPIGYGDRGAAEFQGGPTIVAAVTPVTRPNAYGTGVDYGFDVDMSASKSPFAAVKSYLIRDSGSSGAQVTGGGTSPTGTIWYPDLEGVRTIELDVTDTAGHQDQVLVYVYVGPRNGAPVTPPPATPVPPAVPPPSGAPGQATVRQIGGADRYQTSRMVSQTQWGAGKADAVVLARGDQAPDALAGVPLAAKVHGPLLLTDPAALGPEDRAELDRVLGGPSPHKAVYILGGAAAVSPKIEAELRKAGYTVQRLSGATRYDTALSIAKQFGPTSHVIVATGRNFPDALAAGPLGAVEGAPIVLSDDSTLDPATAAFVKTHSVVDAVGGQARHAASALAGAGRQINAFYGATRYETAESVAGEVVRQSGRTSPAGVGIASGLTFPDALTGGAFAANSGLPLLLTDPRRLDQLTASVLHGWAPTLSSVTIFGGPNAVTRPVADAITRAVGGKSAY